MTEEQVVFEEVSSQLEGAIKSQMFGKPCFKIEKKAFVCFFQNEMVFKLSGELHAEALALEGAKLFDPSGKGRPMKEWVQLPFSHKSTWPRYAAAALNYVKP